MALTKTDARLHGKSVRKSLSELEREEATVKICDTLRGCIDWPSVADLNIYQAIERLNEISLKEFEEWLRATHPEVSIHKQSTRPEFSEVQMDVVIAPCLAVDETGNRVGYGGGGYDQYLSGQESARLVVVCYEQQVVPRIAPEYHDVPANMIVTEQHVRRFS